MLHGNIQISSLIGSLAAGVAWKLRAPALATASKGACAATAALGPRIKDLFRGLKVRSLKGKQARPVTGLITDSRRVVPGSLFFAIPGERADGLTFVQDALARGAVGVVAQEPCRLPPDVVAVQVEDVRKALAQVAQRFYDYPDHALPVIGVTGTNGKTTVSTHTQYLLECLGQKPVGLLGTIAYHLGQGRSLPSFKTTPESVDVYALLDQMRRNECGQAVMEVSSHGLDQHRVEALRYQAAVFLNLTPDHLDYHQGMETYFQAKKRLFSGELGCPPSLAVIHLDDPYGQRLLAELPSGTRPITFGTHPQAHLRAVDIVLSAQGSQFVIEATPINGGGSSTVERIAVHTPLLGSYNVANVLASCAVCWGLGHSLSAIASHVPHFPGVPGRMERIDCGQPFSVLVDYAHTPDGLQSALSMLRGITPGRLLAVFGCGGNRDVGRRKGMTAVAQALADLTWATADNPRRESLDAIFADMRTGVTQPDRIHFVPDRRDAIAQALAAAQPGDCVVLCGKGHENFQEYGDCALPFDDRQVARQCLEELRG